MEPGRTDGAVILDLVFDRGLFFLVLENLGDLPACSVRVKFDRPFSGLGGAKRIDRLTLFRKLEFLAPHKSIEVFLDRSSAYFARDEPTQLAAAISWRTPDEERRSTTVHHDFDVYRDLPYIERQDPNSGRA